MKTMLATYAISALISAIAAWIVVWWKTAAPKVEAALDGADEWLEAKLNIDIPDEYQAQWHDLVHGGVAYANKIACNERLWREVIRAVMARDPSKAITLQAEISKIDWNAGISAIEAKMSDELKAAYNAAKEELATKVIAANAATAIPAASERPDEQQIRAAVRAVAPAHKPADEPVTADTIARLISESQARQAALAK